VTGDELRYLELEDIVRIHARIFAIDDARARRRLRDPGVLESALGRPLQYAVYQGTDVATQAAILAHGIAQSQSFIDGNKPTALTRDDHLPWSQRLGSRAR
jgi:death on curing protein